MEGRMPQRAKWTSHWLNSVSQCVTGRTRTAIKNAITRIPKPIHFHGTAFVGAWRSLPPFGSFMILGSLPRSQGIVIRAFLGEGVPCIGERVGIGSAQESTRQPEVR